MTRVLAIDCGTTSGAACDVGEEGRPAFFTWYGARWSEPGRFGARLHNFDEWASDLISLNAPDVLAFEAPLMIGGPGGSTRVTNHDTVRLLYGLAAECERIAHRHSLRCIEVGIQSAKKHFVGTARAEKRDVMFRAHQLGWGVRNEHEADAAAVWFATKATICKGWQIPIMGRVA